MEIIEIYAIYCLHPVISTDSRNISEGCIFFALKGENFDGNTYAVDALNMGAAYCVVDNWELEKNEKFVVVYNVLETLQQLANYHRKKLNIPILAITGTNGKTTTKELCNVVLSKKYKTVATSGNLNNHIGVPITLLSMNSSTEFGIVEMGANHVGEIDFLCKIAEPNFGLITNIGKAHLEGFGSFEGVIKAKTELYSWLENSKGILFYNSDNNLLSSLVVKYNCKKISYGSKKAYYIGNIIDVSPYLQCSVIDITTRNNTEIKTHLVGSYNFENVLAAFTIGLYFGVTLGSTVEAISFYEPQNSRSQLKIAGSNTLLCDFYNANPTSMEAAIVNFANIDTKGLKKAMMLGEMKELGSLSEEEHLRIVEFVKQYSFDKVYFVGKEFCKIIANSLIAFETSALLNEYLKQDSIKNSFILIKGSRGIKMEKVLESLNT